MLDQNLEGKVVVERFASSVLEGNALGDLPTRDVLTYLPPGYGDGKRYPVIFCLAGFTGTSWSYLNFSPFTPTLPAQFEQLLKSGASEPAILVMVDGMTRVGGNQYINSEAVGRYEDHIIDELVPFIDGKYRTLGAGHRGVMGKSSGGYGAIIHGMRHADTWSAVACHSGDMYFDYCYWPDFPKAVDGLQGHADTAAWLENFRAKPKVEEKDMFVLNIVAMAAFYSPNASASLGIDLPFDLETGEVRPEVWRRWHDHDPVRLVEGHADALRSLKLLFIDCGSKDQFNLHHGARILVAKLKELGIDHVYEEFDDNHSNVQYRYDVSLPKLVRALA